MLRPPFRALRLGALFLLASTLGTGDALRAEGEPSAAEPATAAACPAIEGIQKVLGRGKVVLLGEIHGTAESPAVAGAVACHALRAGLTAVMALELPREEQDAIDGFMASDGSEDARAAVRALPFWAKEYQDGRTSLAMLELLESLRARRQVGERVSVLLIDNPAAGGRRDGEMADRILQVAMAEPERFIVSLTGNIHIWTGRGSARMGDHLLRALGDDRVVSLGLTHSGGTAWICEATAGCGPLGLRGQGEGEARRITLDADSGGDHFTGSFHVGAITASPPAREHAVPAAGEISPPPAP